MPIDPGSPGHDAEHGSGEGSLFSLILAIIISVVIVAAVASTTRHHAVALDEGAPPDAATAPAQPAAPPAP